MQELWDECFVCFQVLRQRLIGRNTETPESVEKRMATATSAIEYSKLFLNYKYCIWFST